MDPPRVEYKLTGSHAYAHWTSNGNTHVQCTSNGYSLYQMYTHRALKSPLDTAYLGPRWALVTCPLCPMTRFPVSRFTKYRFLWRLGPESESEWCKWPPRHRAVIIYIFWDLDLLGNTVIIHLHLVSLLQPNLHGYPDIWAASIWPQKFCGGLLGSAMMSSLQLYCSPAARFRATPRLLGSLLLRN